MFFELAKTKHGNPAFWGRIVINYHTYVGVIRLHENDEIELVRPIYIKRSDWWKEKLLLFPVKTGEYIVITSCGINNRPSTELYRITGITQNRIEVEEATSPIGLGYSVEKLLPSLNIRF